MTLEMLSSLIIAISSLVGASLAIVALYSFTKRRASTGVAGIEAEIEEVRRRLSESEGNVADKQYLLLKEYHAQGLAQSKVSFWFSLIFAALGFAVIVSAIFSVEEGTANLIEQKRTLITLIAGTVIDAVSALFFVQSNKARQLMVDFFDRLRNDRKLEESLKLASGIEQADLRSRLNALLSLSFADIKTNDGFLASLLGIAIVAEVMSERESKINTANGSAQAANPTVERTADAAR